jgi:hypothetical protein
MGNHRYLIPMVKTDCPRCAEKDAEIGRLKAEDAAQSRKEVIAIVEALVKSRDDARSLSEHFRNLSCCYRETLVEIAEDGDEYSRDLAETALKNSE